MNRIRILMAALAVAGLIVAVVPAFAASPKDGAYAQYKGKGDHKRTVISLVVDGNKVTPSFYNKCSPVPVGYTMKVKHGGRFGFEGTEKNVIGDKVDISLKGKFKTKNLAKGTVDYDTKDCAGKAVDFKAKYRGAQS